MIFKVDHNFLQKHRLAVSASFTNGLEAAARFYDNAANPGSADRDYTNRRIAADHVLTISPQSVNTFSAEASSDISDTSSDEGGYPAQLGLTGVPGETFPLVTLDRYLASAAPTHRPPRPPELHLHRRLHPPPRQAQPPLRRPVRPQPGQHDPPAVPVRLLPIQRRTHLSARHRQYRQPFATMLSARPITLR